MAMKKQTRLSVIDEGSDGTLDLANADIQFITDSDDPMDSFLQRIAADPKKVHVIFFDPDDL